MMTFLFVCKAIEIGRVSSFHFFVLFLDLEDVKFEGITRLSKGVDELHWNPPDFKPASHKDTNQIDCGLKLL
jgi:hypothetical protein